MRNQVVSISRKAGVVVWRRTESGTVEILLITARRHPNSWIFPVGTVDREETLEQAAARECAEESGYTVEVGPLLAEMELPEESSLTRQAGLSHCRSFTFYAGQATGELTIYETDRQRRWVPLARLTESISPVFAPVARAALVLLSMPRSAPESEGSA